MMVAMTGANDPYADLGVPGAPAVDDDNDNALLAALDEPLFGGLVTVRDVGLLAGFIGALFGLGALTGTLATKRRAKKRAKRAALAATGE